MFNIIDCEQGTAEWFESRLGVLTASQISKVVSSTGKKSTQASDLMLKLNTEFFLGQHIETHKSEAMLRGNELEPRARIAFEMITGLDIQEVGFCRSESQPYCGFSPDGLGDGFGLEIKCPNETTHCKYLLDGKLPTAYVPQVQFSLWLSGFDSWWFMSYSERFKPFLIQVNPDVELHEIYAQELPKFIEKMLEQRQKLGRKLEV